MVKLRYWNAFMNKFFLAVLLTWVFPVQAADPPESAIVHQKHDQESCVLDLIARCNEDCKTATDSPDCVSRCRENAKNECLEAGE